MEINKLWQVVLAEIELQVSKPTFATLFIETSLVSLENNIATLGCPNPLIQRMIEIRYYALLKNILDKHTANNNSLVFTTIKQVKQPGSNEKEVGPLFKEDVSFSNGIMRTAGLNPFLTFDNFAVSTCNQMAYAAAQAVSRSPGTAYNPLFLYGGVGVGKTHLMQAVGQKILQSKPNTKIVFSPGEEFTNEIIEAIRNKTTPGFREKYRRAQLLLLDDIQFIAGKDMVQEEFFHTFNALNREGGQIILTSDRPPEEISRLEERLRSRFEAGLIIDIAPPDFELRCAILLIKAKQKGINLPMDVAQVLAANISSTRRLEGILIRLATEVETKKLAITPDLAKSILGKTTAGDLIPKKKIETGEVLKVVADRFDTRVALLLGPKRDRSLVLPRQVAMHILRVDCQRPLMDIGRSLGDRDHTTIMHGVEKISTLLSTDEKLREDISWIKNKLWGTM
ncbi:MAG: chromosomal replication initiator protein DnaA [Candidatus Gottesmanbacteria bacterium]